MSANDYREGADGVPPDVDAMIDLYLDGGLEPADRTRFEAGLGTDPALRARVERAREIEDSVRRLFAPPSAVRIPGGDALKIAMPTAARPARPRWVPWGAGIAALLALAVGIQYGPMIWRGVVGGGSSPGFVRGDAALTFKQLEELGFRPEWVRKDDAELAKFTREQFGHPWKIEPAEGLTLVGWTYSGMLFNDNYARVLLAEYKGRRLALVVHEKRFDRNVTVPTDGSIYAHRATFDGLVAYELSPLDKAVVLDRITMEK